MSGHVTQTADAHKAMKASMPYLAVECPKCKAPAGHRCHMELGNYSTHHHMRWVAWQQQKAGAA